MQVTREDIIAAIQQAKVVEVPDSLRSDIKLTDQGVDSLGMFNVILVLQEKYGIEIPDPDIDRLNTIDELIAYLNMRVA
jgi:acyl carrier protein